MKYLHIIPPSGRMMYGYMSMIEQYFNKGEHRYLVTSEFTEDDMALALLDNVINFPQLGKGKIRKFLRIRKEFAEADRIVFHCYSPDKKWLLTTYLLRKYLSKAVWVMWGIDLYNYRSSHRGLLGKIENHMGITCRKMMRYPVAIAEADIEVYKKNFGTYPVVHAPYGFVNERFWQMDTYVKNREAEIAAYQQKLAAGEVQPFDAISYTTNQITAETHFREAAIEPYDGRIRVQVGHNGFPFNNHVKTLRLLERFVNMPEGKRLELVLPTSYGGGTIAGNVPFVRALRSYAVMRFPFHASFLTELVPANQYTRILSSMDIAIFNAHRQNGLGNILQLLYMGKKVYMAAENPLFGFLKSKNFEIHDVRELETASFEEFVAPVKTPVPNPWIKQAFGRENTAKMWHLVFDYCEGKIDHETAMRENYKITMLGDR